MTGSVPQDAAATSDVERRRKIELRKGPQSFASKTAEERKRRG